MLVSFRVSSGSLASAFAGALLCMSLFMGVSVIPAMAVVVFYRRKLGQQKHSPKLAEPGAAPNGGPATQLGNSGVTEGPPSVS